MTPPLKLHVLLGSTRPTRLGPAIARWFVEAARPLTEFQCELIDLKDFDLPVFDEPEHPRLRQYQHAHTQRWSACVEQANAFVFVMPEYNYGPPPALLNALNFLSQEWNYKPVGFVSYGGISGGTRGVQVMKQIVTTVRMVPAFEAVPLPNFRTQIDDSGAFVANEGQTKAIKPMLDELHKLATVLRPLQVPPVHPR